jgi:integrase
MATLTKRGKSYVLNWRENGQQIRVSLGPVTHQQAQAQLQAKRYELTSGQRVITQSPYFEDYAEEYLDWHGSEYPHSHARIRQIVESYLVPYFRRNALEHIEPRLAEAYKASRQAKAGTIVKEIRTLKAMFNKAVEWGIIQANPIRQVNGPRLLDSKPPHWYTTAELQHLYKSSPNHASIWRLMANTGLRRNEALGLRWEHIGPATMRVLSTEERRTKSGRWREIPLSPGAQDALKSLMGGDYVLPRITGPSLSRAFAVDASRAKLHGSLHSLRHTFAAHLVQIGTPLRTVQILMGHSTIRVTEQYAHLAPDYLAESVSGLNL